MSWQKLDSKAVYDNPWITVFEDRVIHPGGGEVDYGVVHFKNVAVAIVVRARSGYPSRKTRELCGFAE